MKLLLATNIFMLVLMIGVMVWSCNTDTEPPPKPEPEKPVGYPDFDWDFKDADWLKESVNLDASLQMLRYIDERIYKLDRSEWSSSGFIKSNAERASYLNIRIQILYHIYNLSKDVKWSVDVE